MIYDVVYMGFTRAYKKVKDGKEPDASFLCMCTEHELEVSQSHLMRCR